MKVVFENKGVTNMDLETIATSSVKSSISVTDELSPFINERDKEPSWDGNIYIYANSDKRKEGIKKVPVQVKGKQSDDFSSETVKYPVTVVDLENYLNDGGVVFFVVYISGDGRKTKIYYSCLLPVKIRNILSSNIKKKKKISIELSSFPEDNGKKVSLFLNFYDHMKKQTSFANTKLQSLDELEKQGVLEGVTFYATNYGNSNLNQYKLLFEDEIYMYANIKGSAIPQPLLDIPMDLHIAENVETDISVNGKVFYTQFQRYSSKDKVVLSIGKSVTISMEEKKHSLVIKFTPTSVLKYAVTDLEFILAIHKYNQFEMMGHTLPLDPNRLLNEDKVSKLQERLEFCRNLIKVLNIFNLNTDVNIDSLSTDDCRHSNLFIKGLVNNEPVSGLKEGLPFALRLNYLGSVVVIGLEEEEQPGTYRIYDYFSKPIKLWYKDDTGEYRTSKYDFLEIDDFLKIRNIDYRDVVQSYKEISEKNIYIRANWILLKLLLAYDKSEDKRKDILDAAYNFADWLYNANVSEDDLELNSRKLNLYQVLKRRGNLSKEQKKELFDIADDIQQNVAIRIGAYLLLDNQIATEKLFDELSSDAKEEFQTFPIFRFWTENM